MEIVQAVLALVTACVAFALLARRTNLPYAVILVIGGIVLAFVFAGLLALAWVARTRAAMPRRGVERASFIDDDPEDDEQD